MKKLFSFIFLLFFVFSVSGSNRDEYLKELDRVIDLRDHYMKIKEDRIDSLVHLSGQASSLSEQYHINNEIYKEYRTYRSDSAWVYVRRNQQLSEELDIPLYKDEVLIAHSYLLSTAGMYPESLDNLQTIDPGQLSPELLLEYYTVFEWSYYVAAAYTNDSFYAPQYREKEYQYRDSVLTVLSPEDPFYQYYLAKYYIHNRNYREAYDILLSLYPVLPVDTRLYARVTFDLAHTYYSLGDPDGYEKFIVKAAISDLVCPLKENLAMQELALYLYTHSPDDLDRAYRYIQCSMEDARFYNNRLRMLQISEKLPVIVQAYQQKSAQEKQKITWFLIAISVLTCIVLISFFYLSRQHRAVQRSRKDLFLLNEQLNQLNIQLQQSNKTKEEYVGIFMDLCSSYIDKLNRFRETVKRKITTKQYEELYKLASSTQTIDSEVDNFLQNFDRAFLTLFPSFVEEFNGLLPPENRVVLKKGELLTAELRIFALIRLGIKESSQIATFLRYSPQTIYNYRTRMRNKAGNNRDIFEEKVQLIASL